MGGIDTIAVEMCILFLAIWTVVNFLRRRTYLRNTVVLLVLVSYTCLLRFAFGFPSITAEIGKGNTTGDDGPLVLALFFFMLAGMGAEYLYHFLASESDEAHFNWRTFVKPFLISPMVFLPLAAALQNSSVDLSRFNTSLLMLFLVAFENGFLWRGYFSRKMSHSLDGNQSRTSDKSRGQNEIL